jgi:hypothetical protein
MRSIEAVQLLPGSGCDLFLCHSCRHDYVERFRFSIVIPKNGQKCEVCRRTWVLDKFSIGRWLHKNNIDRLSASIIEAARKEHDVGKQLYAIIVRHRQSDTG